jgi:hypothetical protein
MRLRPRSASVHIVLGVAVVITLTLANTTPALACRSGQIWTPTAGNFTVGQGTASESYRGIHGGIGIVPSTAPPNVDDYHISVQISSSQSSSGPQTEIWSQVGWQMGVLQRLPSFQNVYSSSPTVYFEGIDNIENFRDTFGAAETLGRYEVGEAGLTPNSKWKYISWFQRAGVWYQAGYSELDSQYSISNAFGEASDTIILDDPCLRLSNVGFAHELGSPDALLVLGSVWVTWTTAIPTVLGGDNNRPYDYANFGSFDHFTVSGP